jgi:hypothetical protein
VVLRRVGAELLRRLGRELSEGDGWGDEEAAVVMAVPNHYLHVGPVAFVPNNHHLNK